ncbi:oleate hydratase [Nocardia suismassiliense]|uniref:oleate hydratase n=1 Tax=Nocardia suismassiliense TaxID=2077092 RepID=UPI001F35EC73|nr:oleate hydratase [Nocardia suismassiliense]
MRVAVIGAGIAGLSAATYLSSYPGVEITVFEREPQVGGRANIIDDAEHCQRLFIDDYVALFDILRQIPAGGGMTIYESMRPVSRMVHVGNEWRRISRLYAIWSRELTFWEKYHVINERRKSVLLADKVQSYKKTLRMFRNFDMKSLALFVLSSKSTHMIMCLPGRTDETLTLPWLKFLERRGVAFRFRTTVTRFAQIRNGPGECTWGITAGNSTLEFDAVISTLVPRDLASVLDASALAHRISVDNEHLHFKVLTFSYADKNLGADFPQYALLARNGVSVMLQRPAARCTAFCTSPLNASDEYVTDRVREMCADLGEVSLIGVRANSAVSEAIYCASPIDPARVLVQHHNGLYFAGSAMEMVYPFDSGEAATRSARAAVSRLLADTASGPAGPRLPGPFTGTRLGRTIRHLRTRRCEDLECAECYAR